MEVKNDKNINRLVGLKFGSLSKQKIINLSSYALDDKKKFALSFGQKCSMSPKKVDGEEVYLGFEKFFKQVTTRKPRNLNEATSFKANITALAHNYCKITPNENSMVNTREIVDAVRKIKKNNKIIITKPDKGSGIVVMDRIEYINKMNVLVGDESKFKKLGPINEWDNTLKIEKKMNNTFKGLVDSKELSQAIINN